MVWQKLFLLRYNLLCGGLLYFCFCGFCASQSANAQRGLSYVGYSGHINRYEIGDFFKKKHGVKYNSFVINLSVNL